MRIEGFNLATGETTDREMTADEIEQLATVPIYDITQMEWPPKKETTPE